jgi:hypothetical protein
MLVRTNTEEQAAFYTHAGKEVNSQRILPLIRHNSDMTNLSAAE